MSHAISQVEEFAASDLLCVHLSAGLPMRRVKSEEGDMAVIVMEIESSVDVDVTCW